MAVRALRNTAALVIFVACVAGVPLGDAASVSAAGRESRFVAAGPLRILSTRDGIGVPAGLRPPGSAFDFAVSNVPAGATAVVLNLTITQSAQAGFVQVFPTGAGVAGASSNLNVTAPGVTIANLAIVPIGAGGQITFFNTAGGYVLADLFGYFESATSSSSGRFIGLATPSRVLDTRDPVQVPIANPGNAVNCSDFATWADANRWFWTYRRWGDPAQLDGNGDGVPCEALPGNPGTPQVPADLFKLSTAGSYRLPVRTTASPPGGVLPSNAAAVVMNVTAVNTVSPGFVQVYNDDSQRGAWSNVNYFTADFAPNLVIAPIASDGSVKFYAHAATHLVVDVIGYFTDATSITSTTGLYVPFTPDRLVDTRDLGGPLPPGTQRTEAVTAAAGLNAVAVSAMFFNATIVDSTTAGFLQLYPTGQGIAGTSSNVNVSGPRQFRPNAAISAVAGGQVNVYFTAGGHYILDAAGYFTASPATTLLNQLTIAAQNTAVPYNRDDWPTWTDADGDCQNARAEVLIRDSAIPVTYTTPASCTVLSGRWLDPWTGLSFTEASDVDIDHTVALANAHRSGGWAWTLDQRTRYANDLDHPDALRPMDDATNAIKSDKGPDEWKPPNGAAWCTYATDWATIKIRWIPTVTRTEYTALNQMLQSC